MLLIGIAQSRRSLVRAAIVLVTILVIAVAASSIPKQRGIVGGIKPSDGDRGTVTHEVWNDLLHRYVDAEGNVDYARWRDSTADLRRLDDYLASFSLAVPREFENRSQQLAFWINAYNAATIRQILHTYATTSDPDSGSGKAIEDNSRVMIGGSDYSLDDIEHSILRQFSEPRIHFALNCGARGCPRLLDEAYDAEHLETQLEQNARSFFADRRKFAIDEQRGELTLSPILNWYASDFGPSTPDVLRRISPWLPDDVRSLSQSKDLRVIYNDYDRTLNDQEQMTEPPLPPPDNAPPVDKK